MLMLDKRVHDYTSSIHNSILELIVLYTPRKVTICSCVHDSNVFKCCPTVTVTSTSLDTSVFSWSLRALVTNKVMAARLSEDTPLTFPVRRKDTCLWAVSGGGATTVNTTDVVASKFWTAKLSVSWSAGTLTLSLVKLAFPDIKGTVVTPSREGALEREGGRE